MFDLSDAQFRFGGNYLLLDDVHGVGPCCVVDDGYVEGFLALVVLCSSHDDFLHMFDWWQWQVDPCSVAERCVQGGFHKFSDID